MSEKDQEPTIKESVLGAFIEKFAKKTYRLTLIKTIIIGVAITTFTVKTFGDWVAKKYPSEHIAVINVAGTITTGNPEGDGMKLSESIRLAFEEDNAKAILLVMNSGGGSPVQAEMTYDTIMYLKEKYDKPVIVSMVDVCASACYFIAAASDKIYAHKSTITGSIGVRMDSWGLKQVISMVGVERRTITTGPYKSILDPYTDMTEEDKDIVRKNALTPMYDVFISAIKAGRGDKITEKDDSNIYNGLFWTGEQAKSLGLVDEIKATPLVIASMLEEYNAKDIKRYNGRRLAITQLLSASAKDIANGVAIELKEQLSSHNYN